jgi:hypothetical protein
MAGARRHLNPFAIVLISNRTGGHFKVSLAFRPLKHAKRARGRSQGPEKKRNAS